MKVAPPRARARAPASSFLLALLPLMVMVGWLVSYESRSAGPRVVEPASAGAVSLPILTPPRPAAGAFLVLEGFLAVAVADPLQTHFDRVDGVGGRMEVDSERRVQRVDLRVDLAPLGARAGEQVEATYALRDAMTHAAARFVADHVVAKSTQVPGVQALECDGTLTFHGSERRTRIELLAVAADKNSLRVQGEFAVDVRDFGLPRSWRYGFVPMDPVVTLFLDLTLRRETKAN
ncbi:MAG: YceI family protein [Planctomycetota bacterium]